MTEEEAVAHAKWTALQEQEKLLTRAVCKANDACNALHECLVVISTNAEVAYKAYATLHDKRVAKP